MKAKVALVCCVGSLGAEVIVGGGGVVVSMVQVKLVAVLWLPAESCALTEKV
jgi:hypothetical protein